MKDELLNDLAARLRRSGYEGPAVAELVGVTPADLHRISSHGEVTATGPLATLVKLWCRGDAVGRAAAAEALAPIELRDLADAGLVEQQGEALAACVQLLPLGRLLLAVDWAPGSGPRSRLAKPPGLDELVMSLGGSTVALLAMIDGRSRQAEERLLDLGCGSGVLTLGAARGYASATGVDLTPRALQLAAISNRLSAITPDGPGELRTDEALAARARFVAGSFLDLDAALGDGRGDFDVIVAQPPLAIGPSLGATFRDATGELDELFPALLAEAAPRLAPGGVACIVVNYAAVAEQKPEARLRDWVPPGCDAVVLVGRAEAPRDYAQRWLRQTAEGMDDETSRWLAYYDDHDVRELGWGAVLLRPGKGRVTVLEAPERFAGGAARHIEALFDAQAYLDATDDAALAEAKLRLSPHLRTLNEGRSELAAGLCFAIDHDAVVATVLHAFDGTRTLRQAARPIAAQGLADEETLVAALSPLIRSMLEAGVLLPPAA